MTMGENKEKPAQPTRAALDLSDLGGLSVAPASDRKAREKLKEVSEASGFPSREPAPKKPARRRARKRPTTGRTYPFNTKIRPETYDKIVELSEKSSEREGRIVSMAEIIERAIAALEVQK